MKHITATYTYTNRAFVTEYGDFAAEGGVLTFDQSLLTIPQWQLVDELPDFQKFEYVRAILDSDEDVIAEIEGENK